MQKTLHPINKIGFLLIFFTLSVIGSALIYHTTRWGPWAFSDSAAYISSAKNFNLGLGLSLISAKGIVSPLVIFPPLYPLLLSIVARFGMDYLATAQLLDVLLFGLLIFIFTCGIMTLTRNFWLALIAGLLVLFSPVMLNHYGGIMTEPLFITFLNSSFFSTLVYIQKQKKYLFVIAVLLTSISPLIRYIGVFTCMVNVLLILLFDQSDFRKKLVKASLFGFFSVLPILAWFKITYTNNTTVGAHAITQSSDLMFNITRVFKEAGAVLQTWLPYMEYRVDLIPDTVKTVIFLTGTAFLFALGLLLYMKNNRQKKFNPVLRIMQASFLTNIIYLIMFGAICLFAVPSPPIGPRMFSPILPSLVLMFCCGVVFFLEQVPPRWKTYATVLMTILMVILIRYYFLRTTAISRNLNENGYGFTAREIQTSGFLKAVQSLPAKTPLIANTPAMTLFYTNRMPYSVDYIPTSTFGTRDSKAEQLFNTQHAALILEFAPIRNVYPDWEARLASFTHGLTIAYKDAIGGIYYSPGGITP